MKRYLIITALVLALPRTAAAVPNCAEVVQAALTERARECFSAELRDTRAPNYCGNITDSDNNNVCTFSTDSTRCVPKTALLFDQCNSYNRRGVCEGSCPSQAVMNQFLDQLIPAGTFDAGEAPRQPVLPRLNVQVPGLQPFTAPLEKVVGEKRIVEIDFIAQYIAGIYRYLIGIVGIAAGVMIVWAGIKWLTAGGMPDRIGSAKKQIAGAIMGVIIALGAYVILFVVNPELVRLKPLHVEVVERLELDLTANENTVPPGDTDAAPVAGAGFGGIPVFKQGQSPWREQPYGDCGGHEGKASYTYSGCGPSSLAMVLKFYGVNADPAIVGAFAVEKGFRKCGKGTNPALMTSVDQNPAWANLEGEQVTRTRALELLREGKPIVFATPAINECYRRAGHYMVATGIDPQGRVRVNDPATCGRHRGGYNGEDGVWAGANGEGVTALTIEKFNTGSVGWYIHPK
ncbi:C39 family peptidase [Candidatus Uhrbacteria bacterium]|nr:C39 family peptidase [Candidatus Uhrbacteria bacterium]